VIVLMLQNRLRRITTGLVLVTLTLASAVGPAWAESSSGAAVPAPEVAPPMAPVEIIRPEPKLTKDEAVAKLEQFFTLPEESANVRIEANLSTHGTTPVWDFVLVVQEGNGATGSGIATVDAVTGRILQFNKAYAAPGQIHTGPMDKVRSEAEARAKAIALVQQLRPAEAAGLHLQEPESGYDNYYGNGATEAYSFTFITEHDAIPYTAGQVQVALDKFTLDCLQFSAQLPEGIHFPAGPAVLTPAAALKVWREGVQPMLSYQPVMSGYTMTGGKPSVMKLVYRFDQGLVPVDAMTGDLTKPPYVQPDLAPGEAVPAGTTPSAKPAKLPLTEAAAMSLATMLLNPPDGITVQPERGMFQDPEGLIRLAWYSTGSNAFVALDPQTGMIRQAWQSGPVEQPRAEAVPGSEAKPQPAPVKATPEQESRAKAAAIAVVQTYFSDQLDQLRLQPNTSTAQYDQYPMRGFTFQRYVNGIPVGYDTISVSIDMRTMAWQSLNSNWTTGLAFPEPANLIEPAKAEEQFFEGLTPLLQYQPVYPEPVPGGMWDRTPSESQLVYVLQPGPSVMLDAFNGEALDYGGSALRERQAAFDQLKGHWAEAELRYALRTQAIAAEKLDPDAAMSRAEAAYMLPSANRNARMGWGAAVTLPFTDLTAGTAVYGVVAGAYSQGWLKPVDGVLFRPTEPVTRAEFAVWAVRRLGLGDLARSSLTVAAPYTDLQGLTAEQQHAAAFLQALGLLAPADRFRGADPLTQAEAAALTVRLFNFTLNR
jgi:hypothetical protein